MTNVKSDLQFDSILFDVHSNSMKHMYQILSDHIAQLIGTPKQSIFDHLMAAEKQENSAIGNGVAIPHMRLERLTKPMIIFAKLTDGIENHEADSMPIDLVCLILSPDYEGTKHLQRLAKVSRTFKNAGLCNALRDTKNESEIRQVISDIADRKMAA